ncbi:MAG: histidine triad nucleotide-binding protein [Calditrichota bacterium]
MDCLFCKIVEGTIPAKKVYDDDDVLAFLDINPVAPEHILVIPKKHIASMSELKEEDAPLMGKVMYVAAKVAEERGMAESGYRMVINNGRDGLQTVFHIHVHVLGKRKMSWPPG